MQFCDRVLNRKDMHRQDDHQTAERQKREDGKNLTECVDDFHRNYPALAFSTLSTFPGIICTSTQLVANPRCLNFGRFKILSCSVTVVLIGDATVSLSAR